MLLICSKCKEEKSDYHYAIDRSKKRGYSYRCRECTKIYQYKYYEKNKEKLIRKTAEYYKQYPIPKNDAFNAHRKVYYALKKGILKKPNICLTCGSSERLHAHHKDYSKPLEVYWLCPRCHQRDHYGRRNRRVKLAPI